MAATSKSLDDLLRAVSRSFYLTLKIAPRAVRDQLGIAYLFCRAADTIADTRLLPASVRVEHLHAYREQFAADAPPDNDALARLASSLAAPLEIPQERELLARLGECFDRYRAFDSEDRVLIRRLVTTLALGMQIDLETFPSDPQSDIVALGTDEELDRYCYHVAGCVGEFWTELACRHLRALRPWDLAAARAQGIAFGRALQMTNILRDADRDFAIGRCYFPRPRLEAAGVDIASLRAGDRRGLRRVVGDLIQRTLADYGTAHAYTLAIPRRLFTMRLACIWPQWIGLETLARLAREPDPCAPGRVTKIARADVYRVMRQSSLRVLSNRALERRFRRLESAVREALEEIS